MKTVDLMIHTQPRATAVSSSVFVVCSRGGQSGHFELWRLDKKLRRMIWVCRERMNRDRSVEGRNGRVKGGAFATCGNVLWVMREAGYEEGSTETWFYKKTRRKQKGWNHNGRQRGRWRSWRVEEEEFDGERGEREVVSE